VELQDYIRVLRKGWILVVLFTLVGVAGGAAASILATPQYEAKTDLFVSVQGVGQATSGDLVQGSSAAQQKVRSYVLIANSPRVLDPVIDELNLHMSAATLGAHVVASSPTNSVVIEIAVNDPDPVLAANIANAVGESFIDVVVNDLESVEDVSTSLVRIQTTQPAVVPSAPYAPNTALNLVFGLLIGLALGVGAAALRTILDTRIHGLHDVELVTDRPVLGGITYDPQAKSRPLIVHTDPRNPRAESFRTLRTNLQFVNLDAGPRTFVVTSSLPGEGKSTTTANLAIALSEAGARVAIVDGDLRLPRLAEYMGLEGAAGLTDVLIGRANLTDVIQRWGKAQLYVLPAGRIPPNPSELLGSRAMVSMLAVLGEQFDFVLIDAPPLLPVTDAAILSRLTAGAIVIAAAGRTKRNELDAALTSLDHIGSKVLGIVMTMLPTKGPDSYGYGAYYGASEHEPKMKSSRKSKTSK
jgi:capsular exopolysaccharide synthesis family protein